MIDENAVIADATIVTDVRADHQHVVIAERRHRVVVPTAVDRDVLTNAVVAADGQRAARIVDVNVLGSAANDGSFADFVVAAKRGPRFDNGPGCQSAIVANDGPGLDDAPRTDDYASTEFRPRINESGGMNLGHGSPFLGPGVRL